MAIDRRRFLGLSAGALLTVPRRLLAGEPVQHLLSCRSDDAGAHFLSRFTTDGRLLMDVRLPARGHGVSIDPAQRWAAVFARRPGNFVWVAGLGEGTVVHKIAAAPGRHFYGHGLFKPEGSELLCTENAYESGEGVIGVYDTNRGFARTGEFRSHGIGPHEIKLLRDGSTVVVANGGIRTHPDLPRIKSNLATMRPNLAYVDAGSGRLLHRHEPEPRWHQLSIRHLDVAPDDRVAIAMQFEGRPTLRPPLIATHSREGKIDMLSAPAAVQRRLRNYCGSVAFSADGERFAVSAPRGGLVTYWSAAGDYLGAHAQADACGISYSAHGGRYFHVSDGNGALVRVRNDLSTSRIGEFPGSHWDNHMVTLSTESKSVG